MCRCLLVFKLLLDCFQSLLNGYKVKSSPLLSKWILYNNYYNRLQLTSFQSPVRHSLATSVLAFYSLQHKATSPWTRCKLNCLDKQSRQIASQYQPILGDPGAVSGVGEKCKRARKNFGGRKVKKAFLTFLRQNVFSPVQTFPQPH